MCGIVAVLAPDGRIDPEALEGGTRSLRHRGPDGMTTWISPEGLVGLGHTRLAIVDIRGGAQPIVSEDGLKRIVVNGEFYDFERARLALQSKGHSFQTRSDSEIALHLYEDLGVDCVHRLRGQFALIVWDESERTLFAARDPFGIKPLFYAKHDGALYLASEAKALFAAGVPAAWDLDAVYRVLHACPDPATSLFAGVRQVPPGGRLVVRRGHMTIERYWDVPAPGDSGPKADGAELADRIGELLGDAVDKRMRADVPVGCLLSGGLDSSAILGLATARSRSRLHAFTVGFPDAAFDERDAAGQAARFNAAHHHVVEVDDRAIADHFEETVRSAEMVQYNAHGTSRLLLSRMVHAAGYRAVLAGEGADELFFGYEFTREAAAATPRSSLGRLALLLRLLRSPRRRTPGLHAMSPWLARRVAFADVPPALLDRLVGGLGLLRSTLDDDFVASRRHPDVFQELYGRSEEAAGISRWPPARQLSYLWLKSLFAGYHLAADRLDMASAVEVRFPFLDQRLFEFTQSLSVRTLVGDGPEKGLLRGAVRGFVPDSIRCRRKQPFWAPPRATTTGNPFSELVQDLLRSRAATELPMLNPAGVLGLADQVTKDPPGQARSLDSLLLALASLSVLQESYGL